MKKIFFIAFFALVALPALAQRPEGERPKPEEMAKRQIQMMRDSLQIDDKQASKIEAIQKEYAPKMMKIRESDMPQGEKMQEMQVLRTNMDFEIKKCLTKEQAKRYQKMQEAMRAKRQERKDREPKKD